MVEGRARSRPFVTPVKTVVHQGLRHGESARVGPHGFQRSLEWRSCGCPTVQPRRVDPDAKALEAVTDERGSAVVPLVRMSKDLKVET